MSTQWLNKIGLTPRQDIYVGENMCTFGRYSQMWWVIPSDKMNKRLREKLDSWDLKSVFLTILLLTVGLVIFFYFTDISDRFRTSKEENYKGLTKGQIVSIQKVARMTQSKWNGTKIIADKYSVSYRYEINGQKFERTDVIPITRKNQKLLKEILDNGLNSICSVKFDIADPKKSLLIVSE